MKRLETLFKSKNRILNIYITAGFPKLKDTVSIAKSLAKNGADIIEIGMPYSDPLADGPTIQDSSKIALQNGITLEEIFRQIKEIRKTETLPIILMGYYNQVLQFGEIKFFNKAKEVGVDGFIIPDLPLDVYSSKYKSEILKLGLDMVFLISPQTSKERIIEIDNQTSGFLYMVSSYATTGSKSKISEEQIEYFKKINELKLKNKTLIGFGISDKDAFETACKYANGAIIGSAFIKTLFDSENVLKTTEKFIKKIL